MRTSFFRFLTILFGAVRAIREAYDEHAHDTSTETEAVSD
jgi:hypothetical protein